MGMGMTALALMATLGIDTSEFDKGLQESEKEASSFGGSLKKGLATGAKIGATAMTALTTATVAGGTALVKGVGNVASYADNIDKMSQKLGISAEAYQEWDAVLQHSGSSIDSMARGMQTLQKNAVNSADKFEKLGISQEELSKMSTEELFASTIKGLQDMGEGAERTALASELLGGSARELGALLNTSSEDTQKMINTVHELGGVMSDDAVKSGAKYQDTLQDMQTSLSGLKNNMLGQLLPASTTVMNGLTKVFTGDTTKGLDEINEGVEDFAGNLTSMLPTVIKAGGSIVTGLVNAISSNSPLLVDSAITVLSTILQAIITNLPILMQAGLLMLQKLGESLITLAPMLLQSAIQIITMLAQFLADNAPVMIPQIIELIMSLAEILTNPDVLVPLIDAGLSLIAAIIEGIANAVPKLYEYMPKILGNAFKSLIKALPSLMQGLGVILVNLGMVLINNIIGKWSMVKDFFADIIKGIRDKFSEGFDKIKEIVTGSITKVAEFFAKVKFEFPKIKLPHFKLEGEFGLMPPRTPKVSIDWYAKAYDEAYMLNSATIFGASGGKLLGGGEKAGSEVVVGTNKLISMMSQAVRNAFEGVVIEANIPVYIGNKKLEDIIVKTQATMKMKRGK